MQQSVQQSVQPQGQQAQGQQGQQGVQQAQGQQAQGQGQQAQGQQAQEQGQVGSVTSICVFMALASLQCHGLQGFLDTKMLLFSRCLLDSQEVRWEIRQHMEGEGEEEG